MSTVHASIAPILVMIGRGGRRFQSFDTTVVDLLEWRHGRYDTWFEWKMTTLHG